MAAICNFLDRKAITELILQYCRSMDRLEPKMAQNIWCPESFADYGEDIFQGDGPSAIRFFCDMNRGLLHYSHHLVGMDLHIHGNRASTQSTCSVSMWMHNQDILTQITLSECCQDQWKKIDGQWGIHKRHSVIEFDDFREFKHESPNEQCSGKKRVPQVVGLWH